MRRLILTTLTVAALTCAVLPAQGCAGALPVIATIVSIASEAVVWVDLIADFAERAPVDDATRSKIAQAVQAARLAAVTLQHTARGADSLSREEVEAAFADFRQAYEALLVLTEPLGVRRALPAGALGVDADQRLRVPPPEAWSAP